MNDKPIPIICKGTAVSPHIVTENIIGINIAIRKEVRTDPTRTRDKALVINNIATMKTNPVIDPTCITFLSRSN